MNDFHAAAVAIWIVCSTGCDLRFQSHEDSATPAAIVAVETPPAVAPQPEPRPAWVDEPPGLHGGVYQTAVMVGPEPTRAACEAKLAPVVEAELQDYVLREFGPVAAEQLNLNYPKLKPRIVAASWEESVTVGNDEEKFLHVQLRFDDKLRAGWQEVVDRWTTATRTFALLKWLAVGMAATAVVHVGLRLSAPRKAPA